MLRIRKASQFNDTDIVVDEADRLSAPALEHLRDLFDRRPLGLLPIGMPEGVGAR